jgi:hypothetical protein
MWLSLCSSALAADLAVTSVGAQGFRAQALGTQSADLLVGQRVRWGVGERGQALVDGRFLVPVSAGTGIPFEESRVRELGYAYEARGVSVLAGRHPLTHGGRRLVDGLQAVAHPGTREAWSLGAWAGLVPDEFTTAPTTRFGAGPVLGYTRGVASVSAVGDLVVSAGGIQRLAALATGRAEAGSRVQADSRVDWVFADGAGESGLADAAVAVQARPADALRIDGLYNAYSTLLYQSRASTDPRVRRFAARIEQLGITNGIVQDLVDPTLHHLIGGGARLAASGAIQPQVQLGARTQLHEDPQERYTRLSAGTGVGGLADDRLELTVDGNLLWIDGERGGDVGFGALVEPVPDAVVAIDTSVRLLFDPMDFDGRPGAYADLFLDVASRAGTTVSAGGSWTSEPSDAVGSDVGLSAFVRLQQWIRPRRPSIRVSGIEPSPTELSELDSTAPSDQSVE